MKRTALLVACLATLGAQAVPHHSPFTLHHSPHPTDTIVTDSVGNHAPADTLQQDKKEKKKKEETEYEKIINKGGFTREGLFRVRHIEDKYYFEVPDSMLGRMLLCVSRFTAVPQDFGKFAGEEVNSLAVYLEQRDTTQLLLRQYVQSQLANDGDNIARTLQQSTVDPIVMAMKVIGRNKEDNAQMVDATPLFKGASPFTSLPPSMNTALKLGGLQADRTYIDTLKLYPTNIEVVTTRTYGATPANSPASKTGTVTLGMNTSIVLLPQQPMRPRLWDQRVGYFVNSFVRFSDQQHKTEHESFISRYRLVPKDKKRYLRGELTEPEKQIVYYIDPATPKKWIPYLMQGVNDWNVAFEAAGFKNAIVAKELPEDGSISLDDARFSAIRYLPSETENAYGPHIVDPRSGEIIEAHVCWYHNVMNLLTKWYMVQCGPLDKRAQKMHFDDKLMGELIRFVSSHEVGHTLGLRHNMGASFATPVEKLRDRAWVEQHGHTASIMDYARFNYVAQPEDKISEKGLFPRINDYDRWAIKWGYQWRPEFKDPETEKKALRAEVTKVLAQNRRLCWSGDEGRSQDPRSQAEDLGDNQMKANEYGLKNLQRVMQNIEKWTAQPDDQTDDLREIHSAVRSQYQRYTNHVLRYLSGRYTNQLPGQRANDYVPGELQREALQWVGRNVLEAPLWLYPQSVINKLGTDYATEIRNRQQSILGTLLSPATLFTMHEAELRAEKPYAVNDYLDDVFSIVWQQPEGQTAEQQDFRRQQQRAYIDILGQGLNPAQERASGTSVLRSDAVLYLEQELDRVEQHLKAQTATPHTRNLLLRIKKIREKYESGK